MVSAALDAFAITRKETLSGKPALTVKVPIEARNRILHSFCLYTRVIWVVAGFASKSHSYMDVSGGKFNHQ